MPPVIKKFMQFEDELMQFAGYAYKLQVALPIRPNECIIALCDDCENWVIGEHSKQIAQVGQPPRKL
jgi:hypothetical protein